ncbi:hypothetical protein N0V93_008757 [Gnomoniopsis smithogilvyi]|uniref:Uncharacterized protein n=1 Tax=Gnomoniopsis smithogilvyi TaxID=1191159 RepID=A0A9W8YNB7_9PEZI|nr:hypothetical protein N0V93_008757 [Gnomoniopsis smithogilvyi]
MAKKQDDFEATDKLKHRYANDEVLRRSLILMGFKDKEIKISAKESDGLSVQLSKQLTDDQKKTIFEAFKDEHEAKMRG